MISTVTRIVGGPFQARGNGARPMRAGDAVYAEQAGGFWSSWGSAGDMQDGSWTVLEDNTRGARWWPAT